MGMNNIMDLSDNSDNSQLFQINSSSQTHLKHVMNGMSNEITFTQQEYNCESFERIIKKVIIYLRCLLLQQKIFNKIR